MPWGYDMRHGVDATRMPHVSKCLKDIHKHTNLEKVCLCKTSSYLNCLKEDAQVCLKYGNEMQSHFHLPSEKYITLRCSLSKRTLMLCHGLDTMGTLIPTAPY